ncbi:MAG TPA: DUF1549 domain-containing protein, partial [Pirellulales bacterium]
MHRRRLASLAAVAFAAALALPSVRAAESRNESSHEFFEKYVRPVLADNCFECHNSAKHENDLRLDSRAAMIKGGMSGPAIVPNNPNESLLVTAIHYGEEPKMPPRGKLKPEQIEALSTWIKAGAIWPDEPATIRPASSAGGKKVTAKDREFWSFRPIADPPVPDTEKLHLPLPTDWPKTSIDSFILAKLDDAELRPSPPADRRTLIRRATFNLTGLPPTPEEIAEFLNDKNPDAYEKVVDRLLASP